MADQTVPLDASHAEPTKTRHRSPNYPAVSLPEAIDRASRLYAADKRAGAPLEAALKHMGFSGKNGKSMMVLSALRKFGLVEDVGGRVIPTQRAVEILVLPKEDARRAKSLRDAALGPEVYRELFEQYSETGLPSDDTLRSELIAYKGFNPSVVEAFVDDFRETLEYASLSNSEEVPSGVEEPMDSVITPEPKPAAAKSPFAAFFDPKAVGTASASTGQAAPAKIYSFGLSPDVTAELRISGDIQKEDLELLRDYVEITIKALSRRQSERSEPGPNE